MVTRSRDFSLALAVLHAFDMASLALQHKKGQGVFHSAALKDCSRVVFLCLGHFSLALAVLHAFDMASLALQHKKGQGVFHSAALKD